MKSLIITILLIFACLNLNTTNLHADKLWTWGYNIYGQLGDGTKINKYSPIQIGTATNWVCISAGFNHSVAIKSDGTLWAWGINNSGQLDDGTYTERDYPVQIGTANNWASLFTGGAFNLALKTDGTLWAWGDNSNGQLGDGTRINRNRPVQIGSDTDWVFVSGGYAFSMAIKRDGTLWMWGTYIKNKKGDSTIFAGIPMQLGTANDWVCVYGGMSHQIGLKKNGTIWVWGDNNSGQLGTGTYLNDSVPRQMGNANDWMKIAAGYIFNLAVKKNGTLWAWGHNDNYELGDGTRINRNVPVQIGSDTDWAFVNAEFEHSSAVKTDGTLWSWGYNYFGQVGDGTYVDKSTPVQIGTSTGWMSIASNGHHTVGLEGQSIRLLNIDKIAASICVDSYINIPFSKNGTYNTGNIFTAQLSDENGNFANPVNIGTLNGTSKGTINCHIPDTMKIGTKYRIRVVSSSPAAISRDNGFDIKINPLPAVSINNIADACAENLYQYTTPLVSGYTYKWSVDNGTISGAANGNKCNVIWKDEDIATIKLVITNSSGCMDSLEKTIKIIHLPQVEISGQDTVCKFSDITFHSLAGKNMQYKWYAAKGKIIGTDTSQYLTVRWDKEGLYTIKLIKTALSTGCKDSTTKNVLVVLPPKPVISGDTSVCAGSYEYYTGSRDSNIKNGWKVTGGVIAAEIQTSDIPIRWGQEGQGTITLILKNKSTGCIDSITKKVTIKSMPKPNITGSSLVCTNLTEIYRSDLDNSIDYSWEAVGGSIIGSSTKSTVTVKWGKPDYGSIKLMQTKKSSGCKDSVVMLITVSDKLQPSITGSLSVCEGSRMNYAASSSPEISNQWFITGGTINGADNEPTLDVNWSKAGTGRIKLIQTVISSGYVDSTEQNVRINPIPRKPGITRSGASLLSSASNGNQWYLNGMKLQDSTSNIIYPSQSGRYQIQVTQNGCQSEISDEYYFDITDVSEQEITGIKIYPNPVNNDVLNIELSENPHQTIIYEIISPLGITIQKGEINERVTKLSLVHQVSGVYYIILKQNEKQEIYKFIVNR